MRPILPGATIGVLGSGQLGRMFAIAARRMGYHVHTLSPDKDTPTGQVSDREWRASFDDLKEVKEFARQVSVVTFEFENIPVETVRAVEKIVPARPSGHVLHITQHRLREKTFLSKKGYPVTPFIAVRSLEDLRQGLARLKCPAVLKTAGFGYDGKGQRKIKSETEADSVYAGFAGSEAVLEAYVNFDRELSVVAARGVDGAFAHYGIMENEHRNHILDVTVSPAPVSKKIWDRAINMARGILESLDVVGVMCVEMFLTKKGDLLINELAPRPHNSGHLTFDACVTSQFEQQLRAVCGLPLGSTDLIKPAAMVNLMGDLWANREPKWTKALAFPHVKLHLYGKDKARPGRKMGHLTAFGTTVEEAKETALRARQAL